MVEFARERHPGLQLPARATSSSSRSRTRSFDAVAAGFLLHHLPDPHRAVAEFARVLAPGGRLAATVWDRPERMRLIGLANEALARAGADPALGLPEGPGRVRFRRTAEFEELLSAAGSRRLGAHLYFTHRAASADELWHGLLGGTVRTAEQVAGTARQPCANASGRPSPSSPRRTAAEDGTLEVPVAAVLATQRP